MCKQLAGSAMLQCASLLLNGIREVDDFSFKLLVYNNFVSNRDAIVVNNYIKAFLQRGCAYVQTTISQNIVSIHWPLAVSTGKVNSV